MATPLRSDGHSHGNFPNYYAFHPPSKRVGCLPSAAELRRLISRRRVAANDAPLLVCDLGCNAGDLTVALAEMLASDGGAASLRVDAIGVDIDAELIERARAREPSTVRGVDTTFFAGDLSEEAPWRKLHEAARARRPDAPGFDLVCCFSTTMWIHLHGGDAGLAVFLRRAAALVRPNRGTLLVEPQPWKCYRSARKRQRRLGVLDPFPAFADGAAGGDGGGASLAIADKNPDALVERLLLRRTVQSAASVCAGEGEGEGVASVASAGVTESAGAGEEAPPFTSMERFGSTEWKRSLLFFYDIVDPVVVGSS